MLICRGRTGTRMAARRRDPRPPTRRASCALSLNVTEDGTVQVVPEHEVVIARSL